MSNSSVGVYQRSDDEIVVNYEVAGTRLRLSFTEGMARRVYSGLGRILGENGGEAGA